MLFRLLAHSLADSRMCLTGIKPAILASQDNVLTSGQGYEVLNVIIELLPWGHEELCSHLPHGVQGGGEASEGPCTSSLLSEACSSARVEGGS